MTSKELNKVQKTVEKSKTATLSGAVKSWCNLFKSNKEVKEILGEAGVEVSKDIVPALVSLAKDKEAVLSICKEILPNIDGTYCQYVEVERKYFDENEATNNRIMLAEKQAEKMLAGTHHKAFGYCSPEQYSEKEAIGYFKPYDKETYRIVKMATKRTTYPFSLIAKCVTYYLTHKKNER